MLLMLSSSKVCLPPLSSHKLSLGRSCDGLPLSCNQIIKKMIFNFETPFVAWYSIPNHQEIKQELLPKIQSDSDYIIAPGNAKTNFLNQSLKHFNSSILNSIVWKPFDEMLQEKQLSPTPSESNLTEIWWNIYSPGDHALTHKHINSDFSGIYLLHSQESNPTVFFHDTPSCYYPYAQEPYTTEHITEGHVILFPSFLQHSVSPCIKERVIVSFNIKTDYVAE